MASRTFRGDSVPVAMVGAFTITGNDVATSYRVQLNKKTVSVLGNAGGVNSTAADLQAALAGSTIPEFQEVTWTVNAATITGTAAAAGTPFATPTTSVSGGAGTIGAWATTTVSAGPNHIDDALNWKDGSGNTGLPANGDDIYFMETSTDAIFGLSGLAAVQPASVTIDASYTGKIGLPDYSSTNYVEFRPKYLQFNGVSNGVLIGRGIGSRSGRVYLDFQSTNAATVFCDGLATAVDQGQPALKLLGTHASNVLNATFGQIGIATEDGTTANWPTIRCGYQTNQASDVTITLGPGCSAPTITQDGGDITALCNVTAWTRAGGTGRIMGTGTIGTLAQDGAGMFYDMSSGTKTTTIIRGNGGFLDVSRDLRGRTYTTLTVTNGAGLIDPFKVITSLAYTTDGESLANSNIGNAPFTLTRS